jgi:hypothetical protein
VPMANRHAAFAHLFAASGTGALRRPVSQAGSWRQALRPAAGLVG